MFEGTRKICSNAQNSENLCRLGQSKEWMNKAVYFSAAETGSVDTWARIQNQESHSLFLILEHSLLRVKKSKNKEKFFLMPPCHRISLYLGGLGHVQSKVAMQIFGWGCSPRFCSLFPTIDNLAFYCFSLDWARTRVSFNLSLESLYFHLDVRQSFWLFPRKS